MAKTIGSKRKKSNIVSAPAATSNDEYTADRFLKGFEGMSNKEIKKTIDLVDEGLKFEAAVEQVKKERKS